MTISHIIALRLIPGAGPVQEAGLDVPGVEYTLKESLLHYAVRPGRLHYTLPDSGQWGVREED